MKSQKGKHLVLSIEVSDTGIGIAKDKISHVFEPFKQEDDSTTRKYGGTGLGLVITKSFIELLVVSRAPTCKMKVKKTYCQVGHLCVKLSPANTNS